MGRNEGMERMGRKEKRSWIVPSHLPPQQAVLIASLQGIREGAEVLGSASRCGERSEAYGCWKD